MHAASACRDLHGAARPNTVGAGPPAARDCARPHDPPRVRNALHGGRPLQQELSEAVRGGNRVEGRQPVPDIPARGAGRDDRPLNFVRQYSGRTRRTTCVVQDVPVPVLQDNTLLGRVRCVLPPPGDRCTANPALSRRRPFFNFTTDLHSLFPPQSFRSHDCLVRRNDTLRTETAYCQTG